MPVVQVGHWRVEGRAAALVLLLLLALIGSVVVYSRPSLENWPMWVSGALWIAFIVYWSAAARNAAKTQRAESSQSRRVHEWLMNASLLLLFIPIPGLRRGFLPQSQALAPAGLAVQAAFFALALWARRHLGRNWSARIEIKAGHQLIRSGPYRWVRHPIYTAMIGMFAGTALVSNTLHALLGFGLITFAYVRKIGLEEGNLRDAFPETCEGYRRSTRRLFPGLY